MRAHSHRSTLRRYRDNARIFGPGDKLDTLEEDTLADVIAEPGNPLKDFDALANVAQVFRDGYWVVRDGEVQSTPPKLHVPAGAGEAPRE